MTKITEKFLTLHNGLKMPILGIGTYRSQDERTEIEALKFALKIGYRLIDTALYYHNQKIIGQALKETKVPREEIFITSKIWVSARSANEAKQQIDLMLDDLGTKYLDLILIHWPSNDSVEVYKGLEEYYSLGKVRAIGLTNFFIPQLENLLPKVKIKPMVNQFEINPLFQQKELIKYCHSKNIQVTSYLTLMRGQINSLELLTEIGNKYKASPAQVALKWAIKQDIAVIPKSTNKIVIHEYQNLNFFDLSKEDIFLISELDDKSKLNWNPEEYAKGFHKL